MRQHLTILRGIRGPSKGGADELRWLAAVLPAAVLPVLASLLYFQWLSGAAWVQAVYVATKAFTLVWPALATVLLLRARPLWPQPEWRRDLRALPLGLVSGAVIVLVLAAALQTPLAVLLERAAPAVREKVATFGIGDDYWAYAVGFSLIHAGIEEYYWRWFLFGALRQRLPAIVAHALAALAFAAHHVVVAASFVGLGAGVLFGGCVAVGGVLWSVLYVRQGTLAGAWVSHILVDLALAYVGFRLIAG